MVQPEAGQMEGTIVIENIIRASRENDIPVKVVTKWGGREFVGVLRDVISIHSGVTGRSMLYLQTPDEDNPDKEEHVCIPIDSIELMTFTTEKGFFDNLLE